MVQMRKKDQKIIMWIIIGIVALELLGIINLTDLFSTFSSTTTGGEAGGGWGGG